MSTTVREPESPCAVQGQRSYAGIASGPKSVLIAEDEAIVALDLKRRLEGFGYSVSAIVPTGREAVERSGEFRPDLVLMDIRLRGEMDGIAAAKEIRARFSIPVVFVTAFADETFLQRAAQAQPYGYLVKPLNSEEVRSTIEIALMRHQFEQALTETNRRFESLNRAARRLAGVCDLSMLPHVVVEEARLLLNTQMALFWQAETEERELVCKAVAGSEAQVTQGMRLASGTGTAGWVYSHKESLTVSDVAQDNRFSFPYNGSGSSGLRALIGVPLVIEGAVFGVLETGDVQVRQFVEQDVETLQAFAALASIAFKNAITVEALRQRTAELEAQSSDMEAFAHTVAHDLKAPLSIIAGYAEVLEQRYGDLPAEEFRRHLKSISGTAFRMDRIIDELLLLAQLRKAEVQLEPLLMDRIVDSALQRLAPMIVERQAHIVRPEWWPAALGYSSWIEEVWVNYISNALKYGGTGVTVELGATVQPDHMIRFWVRDNGPGISPEDQARLFQPFTRLEAVRATGYGLGLSIVSRIVEKLGGQVGVESEPGKGSTFSFTLPAPGTRRRRLRKAIV